MPPTADEAEAPTRRYRGGSVLIGALVVDSVGQGLFIPLSLVFFTELTDVPLGLLGVLLSIANVATLPIPLWAGALADRFGALPPVVGAQLMQAVGFAAYAHVDGPVGILLAATLVALGVRFFWSSIFTALADYADGSSSRLTKDSWFAWANMARTAGMAVGGLITGAVIADGREAAYRGIVYAAAACFTTAAVTIAVFVRAPRPAHETAPAGATGHGNTPPPAGYRALLRDRPFLALTAVNTVFAMTSMMLGVALPTLVHDGLHGPPWLTSGLLVGNTVLLTVLTAPVVARLAPYRRTRLMMASAGLWAAWSCLYATTAPGRLAWVVPVMVCATLMFTLAEVVHAPVSQALATAVAPTAARGRYLAVFQYSFAIASIIGPGFFTVLFELHRSVPWLALAALNGLGALALLLLERRLPPTVQRDAATDAPTATPQA